MSLEYSEVFDSNTTHINSATYNSGNKTLTVVFNSDLNAIQAFGAILQSGNNALLANTDETINISTTAPTRNTSFRNAVAKDQISMSFQIYVPAQQVTFNPSDI